MSEKKTEFESIYNEIRPLLMEGASGLIKTPDGDSITEMMALVSAIGSTCESFNDFIEYNEIDDDADADDVYSSLKEYEFFNILEFIGLVAAYAFKDKRFDCSVLQQQFGYDSCLDGILAYLNSKSKNADKDTAFSALQAIQRDVSFDDYTAADLYLDDIKHIRLLFQKDKETKVKNKSYEWLADKLVNFLGLEDGKITFDDRLKYIMESSYALKEYMGIWTCDITTPIVGLNRNNNAIPSDCISQRLNITTKSGAVNERLIVIEPVTTFRTDFSQVVESMGVADRQTANGQVYVSKDRCFNFSLILDNFYKYAYMFKDKGAIDFGDGEGHEKVKIAPIYFPYKMLEIISKYAYQTGSDKDLTYSTTGLDAKTCGTLSAYVDYEVEHMMKELKHFISSAAALFVYKHGIEFNNREDISWVDVESLNAKLGNVSDKEKADIVIDYLVEYFKDEYSLQNRVVFSELKVFLNTAIKYCVDCMTMCVLLYKETLDKDNKEKIIEFFFKFCVPFSDIQRRESELGISAERNYNNLKCILKDSLRDKAVQEDISSNFRTKLDSSKRFVFYDFKHTADRTYIESIPLFAYKALDALNSRNADKTQFPVSWKSILLGKDAADTLVFSRDGGAINFAHNQAHWIVAGSRSGKGVMCFNIFATAAASKVPIFYVDRKPDTAVALVDIANDMFAVNGGDASDLPSDPNHLTAGGSLLGRGNNPINAPEYLKTDLTVANLYDIAYTRAFMLLWQMVAYMDNYKDSEFSQYIDGLKKSGQIAGQFVFVVDEFTNYLNNTSFFQTKFNGVNPSMFGKSLMAKDTDVRKASSKLSKTQSNAKASEDDIGLAEKELERAEQVQLPILNLYYTALYNGFKTITLAVEDKINAAGAAVKTTQNFFIGQNFNALKASLDKIPEEGSTVILKSGKYSPFVELARKLTNSDYIIGYNQDYNYLGQHSANSTTHFMLNQHTRGFAYKQKKLSVESVAEIEGSPIGKWSLFKPFLILNNSDMPDINTEVPRLTGQEASNWAKDDAQKLGSKKYVAQCLGYSMAAGITPEQLVNENGKDGVLDKRVGLSDYIEALSTREDGGSDMPAIVDSLNMSGQIMDKFLELVYGYTAGWRNFIYDLNPENIVTWEGIIATEGTRPTTVQERLKNTFFSPTVMSSDPIHLIGEQNLGNLVKEYTGMDKDTSNIEFASGIDIEPTELDNQSDDIKDVSDQDALSYDENEYDASEEGYDDETYEDEESEYNEADIPTSNPFNMPKMGLNFVEDTPQPAPSAQPLNIQNIKDAAFETLCAEVVKKVTAYVRTNYGDDVADNEGIANLIHKYAWAETTAYLQEGGLN